MAEMADIEHPREQLEPSAAQRIDEAVSTIQRPVEVLARDAVSTKQHLRLISFVLAFDLALSALLGYVGWQSHVAAERANRSLTVACEAGNEFKRLDLQRWQYIIQLSNANPPANLSADEKARAAANLKAFQAFLAVADAERTCR